MQHCSHCEREWPDDYKACPHCGCALTDTAATEASSQVQSGGVHVESEQMTVQGDATGRDKTVQGDEVRGDQVGRDKIEYHIHYGEGVVLPKADPPAASRVEYDLQAVRELLSDACSDSEVTTLAFECAWPLYNDEMGSGMSRGDKILRLVTWCERHGKMEDLLAGIKKINEYQYRCYAGRIKRKV